jgi:hypothetical protein
VNALAIPQMREAAIANVGRLEAWAATQPQVKISTQHVLHAGLYARTIMLPAGTQITGALVEVATTLIVCGDCTVALGEGRTARLTGYHVLPASGRRKQAFLAHADTYLTMVFATSAKSVGEAEEQFTAEAHKLMSRQLGHANTVIVTGL